MANNYFQPVVSTCLPLKVNSPGSTVDLFQGWAAPHKTSFSLSEFRVASCLCWMMTNPSFRFTSSNPFFSLRLEDSTETQDLSCYLMLRYFQRFSTILRIRFGFLWLIIWLLLSITRHSLPLSVLGNILHNRVIFSFSNVCFWLCTSYCLSYFIILGLSMEVQ
jgi:hypothetical protein